MAHWQRAAVSLAGLVLAALLSAPRHSSAASITWTFEGTLRAANAQQRTGSQSLPVPAEIVALGVSVGAPVSGFLRFESTTVDSDPSAQVAHYLGAVTDAGLTIGGWSLSPGIYTPDPGGTLADVNVAYYPPDAFGVSAYVDSSDPTGALSDYLFLALELSTSTPGVITSDAMLIDPPPLASLDPFGTPNSPFTYATHLAVNGCSATVCATFLADVSRLERVPEPHGTALIALVATALVARRRSLLEYLRGR